MDLNPSNRIGLRRPVNLEVHCALARGTTIKGRTLNLSVGGLFLRTRDSIALNEDMGLKFRLPDSLHIIEASGVALRCKSYTKNHHTGLRIHTAGVKFTQLNQSYREMIEDYTLNMLCHEEIIRHQGILQLMHDIHNLPPAVRLKAYHLLIERGRDSSPKSTLELN
jgi:hypothetical protein